MFLYILNNQESEDFLELAVHAMHVNGELKECERDMFEQFKVELGIPSYQIRNIPLGTITNNLKNSSKAVRRSIIIEISSILYSDKDFDNQEKKWLTDIAEQLDVPEKEYTRLMQWSQDFSDFLEVGLMYINSK